MKKISLFILIPVVFSCKNKEQFQLNDYDFIEKEINFYFHQIQLKIGKYHIDSNFTERENLNHQLYYKAMDYYHNNRGLIQIIKKYPPDNLIFKYDDSLYRARDCGGLYDKIVDTTRFFDTLYLHNVKFEYIKCLIKNSKYYDSIPELKARIESYDD